MTMRDDCKEAAKGVLGKSASEAQLRNIEEGIRAHKMALARKNPAAWRALSEGERVRLATESRIKELKAAALEARRGPVIDAEKQLSSWRDVLAQHREGEHMQQALGEYVNNLFEVKVAGEVDRMYAGFKDGMKAFKAKWFGFVNHPKLVSDIADESFGKDTGNTMAKSIVKELKTIGDAAIERLRKAGIPIGQLDYGYLPQTWTGGKVRELHNAGKMDRDKFADMFAHRLMLRHYISENGDVMSLDERKEFLRQAYDTISTDGFSKLDPEVYHKGSRTPKFAHARQIHFADGATYLEAMKQFSDSNFLERLKSHLGGLARAVTLAETLGRNPERTFSFLENMARKSDGGVAHTMKGSLPSLVGLTPKDIWDRGTGKTEITNSPKRARIWQAVRNYASAVSFGGVLPQQVSDLAGIFQTAGFNHIPPLRLLGRALKGLLPSERRRALAEGIGLSHVFSEMSVNYNESRTDNFTGRLAALVQRIGLTHWWAKSLDIGSQVGIASDLAEQVKTPWDQLSPERQRTLLYQGVRKEHWDIWHHAEPQMWGKDLPMLNGDAVAGVPHERVESVIKDKLNELGDPKGEERQRIIEQSHNDAIRTLLGFLEREGRTGVHRGSNLQGQAMVAKSGRPGELGREIAQSFGAFGKSYVYSYMAKLIERANFQPTAMGRIQAHMALWTTMAVASAVSEQLIALAHGNDPEPMLGKNSFKFWFGTIGRVGLNIWFDAIREGYYGMKYMGENEGHILDWFGGPVAGELNDIASILLNAAGQAPVFNPKTQRESRKQLPKSVYHAAKSMNPLSAVGANAPYAVGLVNYLLTDRIHDMLDPGATERTRMRLQQEGQGSWLYEGRAPHFGTALGAQP